MPKFKIYKVVMGYYFVLVHPSGQILCHSEHYASRSAAENGIEAVKKNAPIAEVVDETDI